MILVYGLLAAVGAFVNAVMIGTPLAIVVGMVVAPASYAAIMWWRPR